MDVSRGLLFGSSVQLSTPYTGYLVVSRGSPSPDGVPRAYNWSTSTGFGTQITASAIGAGDFNDVDFAPDGSAVAFACVSTPYVAALSFSSSGFGSRYSDPSTLVSSQAYGVRFSSDSSVLFVSSLSSPYVHAYAWDSSSGFGSKYSDPVSLSAGAARSVDVTPAMDAVIIGGLSTPYHAAYAWDSSTGFGTRYSNASNITRNRYQVRFSPLGDAVITVGAVSPYHSAYAWSSSTGFGAQYSDPVGAVIRNLQNGQCIDFTSDGSVVFFSTPSSPYLVAYPWSSSTGYGTKYADPSTGVGAIPYQLSVSPDDSCVAIGHSTVSPYIRVYPWSSSGFGTIYSNPSTALTVDCRITRFSP